MFAGRVDGVHRHLLTTHEHEPCTWAVNTAIECTEHPSTGRVCKKKHCTTTQHGPWTRAFGTHYPCSQPVNTTRILFQNNSRVHVECVPNLC